MSSTFGKSFTREMGKNTGKVVSNVLFGDWHSTPYRRVGSNAAPRVTQAQLNHERQMARIEAKNAIIDAENERRHNEQMFALDAAVLKNVDAVVSIRIPNDKDELLHLLSELSVQVQANQWQWEYNDDEQKIRNKFVTALLEKYKQCVLKLKSIAPNDPQLEYYENIIKKSKRKKFWKKNGMWIGIVSAILFFVLLIVAGVISEEEGLSYGEGLALVFSPIFFIAFWGFIIWAAIKLLKKFAPKIIKHIKEKKQEQSQVQQTQQYQEPAQTPIPEQNYIPQESIFIDLNENNRIETKLSAIWNRYKNSVDKQIINRKPIFSADGVKDSILFVGVNPSFNPNDDKIFVHSADDKTLMYGSLYQIPNAPDYFKALEIFAEKAGKSYSHINLLYARENDRNLLLSCDHNFIREQLELTYETIKKINPVAIVFFTDYCKDLIFAHWVNSNNSKAGSYILNGTNYPVFFSDDVTAMNETEQIALIQKIKFITK